MIATAVHIGVEVTCCAFLIGLPLFALCQWLTRPQQSEPHVPAGVDLEQCRATPLAVEVARRHDMFVGQYPPFDRAQVDVDMRIAQMELDEYDRRRAQGRQR